MLVINFKNAKLKHIMIRTMFKEIKRMKQLLTFWILFSTINCCSQETSINDLLLKGSPRSVEENLYLPRDINGTISKEKVEGYAPFLYGERSLITEIEEKYDIIIGIGNRLKIEFEKNKISKFFIISPELTHIYDFHYQGNRLDEIVITRKNESKDDPYTRAAGVVKYKYDNQSRNIEVAEYNPEGNNVSKIIKEYLAGSDKLISKTIYKEGKIERLETNQYVNNTVITTVESNLPNLYLVYKLEKTLNENNQVIKELETSDTYPFTAEYPETYSYNEKKDLVKKIESNVKGKIITEYEYKYDANGNWIEVIFFKNGSVPLTV